MIIEPAIAHKIANAFPNLPLDGLTLVIVIAHHNEKLFQFVFFTNLTVEAFDSFDHYK